MDLNYVNQFLKIDQIMNANSRTCYNNTERDF